ncbi:MAG: patatin-like phospholipase family protein [Chitinophagaceae bacterium]|nr:patatin-like phospholipase family protein [Chitinophagaceae bacterium]
MSKHALVINGGISRGAFAVGAIKKIFEYRPELDFQILSGGGSGSLIIPFVSLKDMQPLVEIFTTKHNRDIIKKFSLSERLQEASILDASPLWGLLDHYYTHRLYDRLCDTDKMLYFNTMCLQTHALTVFSPRHHPEIASRYDHRCFENYDQFLRTLLASTCQPVLLPPIRIQPQEEPVRQYIDAGDREYAGIEMAIASGATDVYVLLQTPAAPAHEDKEYRDIFSILQKTLDIFIADAADDKQILPHLYNEGLRYIQAVKRKMGRQGVPATMIDDWFDTGMIDNPFYNRSPVRLHIIRPDLPLGGGPDGLSFDPAMMQEMLAKGEQAMATHLALTAPQGG